MEILIKKIYPLKRTTKVEFQVLEIDLVMMKVKEQVKRIPGYIETYIKLMQRLLDLSIFMVME